MIDFMKISTRQVKKGVTEIFPKFVLKKSSDLMIRGGDFYAVWNEDTGLWSTDEEDVINMVDAALYEYTKKQEEHAIDELNTKYMWDRELSEDMVSIVDEIDIRSVNLDVRPYDWEVNGKTGRTAYLQSMEVIQEIDRFAARYAEEESPEE